MLSQAPVTPYSKYLGDRDPLTAIGESTTRIRSLTSSWSTADYERSYAPGKWTAQQILIHLVHAEIALGNRVRMALTTPGYAAQAFDQDQWLARESTIPAQDALNALLALAAMDLAFFQSLSPADRQTPMRHPEFGSISVDWVIHTLAGHQINHLRQLEQIGSK